MPHLEQVWVDGVLVPWDQATVHVAAHALHYGSAVFEGIRTYPFPEGSEPPGTSIFRFDQHLDRLWSSSKVYRLNIPYTREEIHQATLDTIRANGEKACYIRHIVLRGWGTFSLNPAPCPTHVAIILVKMGAYLGPDALEKGVDVGVVSWQRMAPNTLAAAAKISGQYVNSQFAVMEAVRHGYTEAIALDVNGFVSEGSGENIFAVWRDQIYTPPIAGSILDGITRRCVFTLAEDLGLKVREESIPREMLYMADEVFFCGTAAEITPIRTVDGIQIGNGKRGPITNQLMEAFFDIVEGRVPDRHGWLTPVPWL
jgi:branched-chain amino acid aminotransferase